MPSPPPLEDLLSAVGVELLLALGAKTSGNTHPLLSVTLTPSGIQWDISGAHCLGEGPVSFLFEHEALGCCAVITHCKTSLEVVAHSIRPFPTPGSYHCHYYH